MFVAVGFLDTYESRVCHRRVACCCVEHSFSVFVYKSFFHCSLHFTYVQPSRPSEQASKQALACSITRSLTRSLLGSRPSFRAAFLLIIDIISIIIIIVVIIVLVVAIVIILIMSLVFASSPAVHHSEQGVASFRNFEWGGRAFILLLKSHHPAVASQTTRYMHVQTQGGWLHLRRRVLVP